MTDPASTLSEPVSTAIPPTAANADGANQGVADQHGADQDGADLGTDRAGRQALLTAALSLTWLLATLWSAHVSVSTAARQAGDMTAAVSSVALTLPGVIAANLLAGAACAALCIHWLAPRGTSQPRTMFFGAAAAMLPGLISAAGLLIRFDLNSAVVGLAITIGAASLLAGALAGLLPRPIRAAGIGATIGAYLAGALTGRFQSPLKSLFGAGRTVESQLAAARSLSLATALVAAVVAGLLGYWLLRRLSRDARWPSYLLAGAVPGLLLLAAEALTALGGANLRELVSSLSIADRAVIDYLDAARINHALVVAFLGAITAQIAFGRTLRAPGAADQPSLD